MPLPAAADAATPLVEMRGIRKRYGGVRALDGADFAIYPREIHALVGDNAAGKSSLIKALSGAAPADEGQILFEGRLTAIREPRFFSSRLHCSSVPMRASIAGCCACSSSK